MRSLPLALLCALAAACVAPAPPSSQRFAPVHIALGDALDDADPWFGDERKELVAELAGLGALGPAFVLVDEGAADLVWRPFDSKQADPQHRPCGAGAARYSAGADYVEIDPTCCEGFDLLRAAAAHETGHWLGLPHICEHGERDPSCDLSLGEGEAVMNPSLAYHTADGPEEPAGASAGIDVATTRPTALDVAAFNRVRARARREAP